MNSLNLFIDGTEVQAAEGQSVLNAALAAGIYIPHLCSHPDLEAVGGCKLCIVEVDGEEKPVTACTTPVCEGMRVTTRSPRLDRLRRVSMELMLAEHPHDCTGCRSFGSCEFQALMQYLSVTHSRMHDVPRHTTRINRINPLIDREMERCIQCGRCVRACRELRGVKVLDFRKRGGETYIGTEQDLPLTDADCRFCSACVEVCPTGALQDHRDVFRTDLPRDKALIPCTAECPAHINIPNYLRMIHDAKYAEAVAVIREKAPFPHALGYVCTRYCEKGCKRRGLNSSVSIRDLKRFAVEHDDQLLWKRNSVHLPPTGKCIAVVGAGPCGLTAAYYLAKRGHDVTVFERLPVAGGMLATGIPAYRLPRADVQREVDYILEAGVRLEIGADIRDVNALKAQGYDGVLVAVGAAAGKVIPLEGYTPGQCITAVEFLRAVSLGRDTAPVSSGKTVTVLGGGNVAFDAARTAIRLGARVNVVCLESRETMPADEEEIEDALEEGVNVYPGKSNLRFETDGETIVGLRTVDITSFRFEEGRLVVDSIPGTETVLAADVIIFAAGQKTDLTEAFGLELNRAGYPICQTGHAISGAGVFAAGDVITGTKAVIDAIAQGRAAASELDCYLGGDGNIEEHLVDIPAAEPNIGRIDHFAGLERPVSRRLSPEVRVQSFDLIDRGLTEEEAWAETTRCLKCPLRVTLKKVEMWTAFGGEQQGKEG